MRTTGFRPMIAHRRSTIFMGERPVPRDVSPC